MINVKYSGADYGVVRHWELDRLIQLRKIVAFERCDGWVQIGRAPIRGKGGTYDGAERRKLPHETTREHLWHRIEELEGQLRVQKRQLQPRKNRDEGGTKRGTKEALESQAATAESEDMNQVQNLSGLLSICAMCHKIRDDNGVWNYLETYIAAHSEVQFSHGICHDCAEKHYGLAGATRSDEPLLYREPTQLGVSDSVQEESIKKNYSSFVSELENAFSDQDQGYVKKVLVGPKLFPYSLPPQLEMLLLDEEDHTIVFRPTSNPHSLERKKGEWMVGKPIDAVKYVLEWAHKMRTCCP